MRTRRRKRTDLAVLLLAGLVLLGGLATAQQKPIEQLVPEDVSDFYIVRNYTTLKKKLEATPYADLLKEPEVKALTERLAEELSESLAEFRNVAGIKVGDVANLPTGQVALVMKRNLPTPQGGRRGGQVNPPQWWVLVIVDVGPNADRTRAVLDRVIKRATQEKNVSVTEETFHNHPIRHLTITRQGGTSQRDLEKLDPELRKMMEEMEAKKQAMQQPVNVYVNLEGGLAVIGGGTDRSLLEKHLVLRDGGDVPPLSQKKLYRKLMNRVKKDSDYISYQSYGHWWDQIGKAQNPMLMMMGINARQILDATGISNIEGTVSGMRVMRDGIMTDSFVSIPAPRKGLLKAIVPKEKVNVRPPAYVDSDTALYGGLYFDTQTLWAEILEIVKQINPQSYNDLQKQMNNPQSPIHPERDLINTLGKHWYFYVPRELIDPNPPRNLNICMAAELEDAATLQNTLGKIMNMPQMRGQLSTTQFMGKTIYQGRAIPLGGGGGPGGNTPQMQICMVFVDDQLILTTSLPLAQDVVRDSRRPGSPLLQKAEFRRNLPKMLNRPEMFFYADARHIGKWGYKLAEWVVREQNIDVKLPRFQTLEKYLYVTTSSGKWEQGGLAIKNWQPYPPTQGGN